MDYGYEKSKAFIEKKIIAPFIDIDELLSTTDNFKSLLLEWGDKENKEINFDIIDIVKHKSYSDFVAQVLIDGQPFGKGTSNSKKKAEQRAAEIACKKLKLKVQ